MKIIHAIFCLDTGGAETMLVDIINRQCINHQVSLIIINNRYSENLLSLINPKVAIYKIGRTENSKNPLKILYLNYIIARLRPDAIHCHNANIARLLLYPKKHLFLTVHDTMQDIDYYELYNKIFAISKAVKEYINSKKHFNNIIVIPNGICNELILPKTNTAHDIFKIVQVSRLYTETKGQDILFKSIHLLINKGIKNISLDLIGEGKSETYLRSLSKELGIEKYVNFLRLKDRKYIYSHLQEYDLFVQPSIYEGFGLTVAEAMVAQVPVLVSNIEGPMEIIDSGKYGSYFEVKNYRECAMKIENIMHDYPTYQKLAQQGYNHVAKEYSIENTVKQYLKEYVPISMPNKNS